MSEKYEQMELDTRPLLQAAIEDLTQSAITNTGQLIKEHHRQVAQETMTAPPYVRNRHEAYGIAAEQLAKITGAVKSIKDDTGALLGTLADPNFNAIDATSSIVNSTVHAAYVLLVAPFMAANFVMNQCLRAEGSRDAAHPGQPLHGGEHRPG